jgi:RNA polymerase sigma factor (sigma-70 family)
MTNLSAVPALTEGRTCSLEAHSAHEAPVVPPRMGGRLLLARRTDERLVEMVRQGDAAAFEVLYDRYHLRILSFCRHMLGSQPDGEDATQHAFVGLHRHITADERPVDVKPWLFQVARNRCLSILRARREHADIDDVQPATEGLADSVQRRDDLREVLGDLQQLPEDQRAALLLSSLGDLGGDEIAEVIGCRPQKVKALVFQARTSLMNEREARDTSCEVVREQLATLRGGALLRGPLRRHVRHCDGCRAFRDATRKQREALALLLPVVPTAGLKAATMSAALGGSAAAGTAATAGAGGGVLAGLAATGKAGAAKVLVAAALAGGTVGAGVAEVKHLSNDKQPAAPVNRHQGQTGKIHKTSKVVPPSTAAKHAKGKANGHAHNGHKPTSSPAKSSHAATGKGIAGTQHHAKGKAGAPGQLKTKTNNGKALAKGKINRATRTPPPTAHTTPPQAQPAKPTTPPGQAKQQSASQTESSVATVIEETTGAVNGNGKK